MFSLRSPTQLPIYRFQLAHHTPLVLQQTTRPSAAPVGGQQIHRLDQLLLEAIEEWHIQLLKRLLLRGTVLPKVEYNNTSTK